MDNFITIIRNDLINGSHILHMYDHGIIGTLVFKQLSHLSNTSEYNEILIHEISRVQNSAYDPCLNINKLFP